MARRAKVYKLKTQPKKKTRKTTAPPLKIIPIQAVVKERVQRIDFNQRYYQDLLDRL